MELPIAEIVERKIKINLIDIVHPPEVIAQTGNLENVNLVEDDVTGGLINEVWLKSSKYLFLRKLKSLEKIIIPEYIPDSDPGLVISLNILTQLESLPVEFLRKRSNVKEEEFLRFRTEIQKKHIGFLMKHRSVLISDIAEIVTDRSGNTDTIQTLVAELPEGRFSEEWTWNFDMKSTDYYNKKTVMKVCALTI